MLFSLKFSCPRVYAINVPTALSLKFILLTKVSVTAIGFIGEVYDLNASSPQRDAERPNHLLQLLTRKHNLSCRRNAGTAEKLWGVKGWQMCEGYRLKGWKGWKLLPVPRNNLLCTGGVPRGSGVHQGDRPELLQTTPPSRAGKVPGGTGTVTRAAAGWRGPQSRHSPSLGCLQLQPFGSLAGAFTQWKLVCDSCVTSATSEKHWLAIRTPCHTQPTTTSAWEREKNSATHKLIWQ